ncbi:MAG TPA: hypothetical protein VKA81_11070 [Verrucomicrobiae bacterium]|nr:hypothetical protein [Verrucomicrobiae bacterium]
MPCSQVEKLDRRWYEANEVQTLKNVRCVRSAASWSLPQRRLSQAKIRS